MDCQDALVQLECVRLRSSDLQSAELQDAAMHLSACASCAEEFSRRQQFDGKVHDTLCDVAPPAELKLQLLDALKAASAGTHVSESIETCPKPMTRRVFRRRTFIAAAAVLSLVFCVGLTWSIFFRGPSPITLQAVRDGFPEQALSLQEFDGSFAAPLPDAWSRHSSFRFSGKPAGWSSRSGSRNIAAVYRFSFQQSRRTVVRGTLLVFCPGVVSDSLEATNVSFADIRYNTSGKVASAAWGENGTVYLVLVEGGAGQLEQLQQALQPRIG